jgi:DNA-binding transcriptional ArsR family regulator
MSQIVLDAEAFKALASDTRLQILKALDARPLTVSELSRLLELNKATVFEHLKQLAAAELVKKEDDSGRKWVYYKLTWKGRNVLHPENVQIFLMLGLGAMGLSGMLLQLGFLAQGLLDGGSSSASEPAPQAPDDFRVAASSENADSDTGGGGQDAPTQEGQFNAAPPVEEPADPGEPATFGDWIQSQDFALFLAMLALVVLSGLLWWALGADARRERRKMRARIATLPAGINANEAA